jgi:hypothetical protein
MIKNTVQRYTNRQFVYLHDIVLKHVLKPGNRTIGVESAMGVTGHTHHFGARTVSKTSRSNLA